MYEYNRHCISTIFKNFIETIPEEQISSCRYLSDVFFPSGSMSWDILKDCDHKALREENGTIRPKPFYQYFVFRLWSNRSTWVSFSVQDIERPGFGALLFISRSLPSIWRPPLATKSRLQKTVDLYRGTKDNMDYCNIRRMFSNLEEFPTSTLVYDYVQYPKGPYGVTGLVDLQRRFPNQSADRLSLSLQSLTRLWP
ncbi:uncharacterized protein PgNI_08494 [Pyricularia grisea]|uniref:Uncharacterized protein n=1 Tax=Pyricularia grisea TaxID=148305 RepID=A0A6P8AVJ4_PYRGI|nr:uncharacterized protein PgNI_08494 [Pyricularia grisea]TLD06248.1 hypothetical protein PgNI_08494 [Pyricularia grisea]